jgi:hypothetical protein
LTLHRRAAVFGAARGVLRSRPHRKAEKCQPGDADYLGGEEPQPKALDPHRCCHGEDAKSEITRENENGRRVVLPKRAHRPTPRTAPHEPPTATWSSNQTLKQLSSIWHFIDAALPGFWQLFDAVVTELVLNLTSPVNVLESTDTRVVLTGAGIAGSLGDVHHAPCRRAAWILAPIWIHSGRSCVRTWPHRRCGTSRPDLGWRWPSRLVATAQGIVTIGR